MCDDDDDVAVSDLLPEGFGMHNKLIMMMLMLLLACYQRGLSCVIMMMTMMMMMLSHAYHQRGLTCIMMMTMMLMLLQAYYQRGLARMKLKQSKGVQDFNRALAINPNIFQVTPLAGLSPCPL